VWQFSCIDSDHAPRSIGGLIWINFAHLFAVSLVPFAIAWVARTRLAAVPVFVYAAVFVLVELAYLQFEHLALAQAVVEEISDQTRRLAKLRSVVAFGLFLTAMLLSLKFPLRGFGLVCCAVLLYLRPEPFGTRDGTINKVASKHIMLPEDEDFTISS
jgi:uncharacterized membrane protein